MTQLEPSNPVRVAREVCARLDALAPLPTGQALTLPRVVELSRLFSSVQVLADLRSAEWLHRAATAALAGLGGREPDATLPLDRQVALERATQEIRAAVAQVADDGDLDEHESQLRLATAMLTVSDEVDSDLSDLDLFVGNTVRELEVTRLALDRLADDPTDREAIAEAFRAVHAVRGDAGVMDYDALGQVCVRLENVLDALRSGEAVATGSVLAALQQLVDVASAAVLEPGRPLDPAELDALARSIDDGRSLARATRLGELLVDQHLVDAHDLELALAIQSGPVGRTLVNLRVIGDDDLDQVLELQRDLRREGARRARGAPPVRQVSVSEDVLRDLTRAVRELQGRVVDLPTIPLVQEVARLVETLQRQTMGTLFRKLARASRALGEELGKDVWVSVSGSDVEAHRDIVIALDSPLLQIVRNALDHGIERPARRQVAGKSARATLTLAAQLEGRDLVVEVADDGAGIDVARVLQRAVDMGLVSPGEGLRLTDQEIISLIFEPGLSAAERVGRISGRGVGMDVVENAVAALGGRITVESERGLGTRFRLRVPHRR